MRNKILISVFLLALIGLFACEDDAIKVKLKSDVTANVLSPLSNSPYTLTLDGADNNFDLFKWTAPDYGFVTAPSYTLQIDKAGNNFASAVDLITTTELSATIKNGDLNKKLLGMGLTPDEASSIEARIRTSINDNVAPVYSNIITFDITPYATIFPPIYMIGDATGGWDLAKAVKLRSIAPSKYQTTAEFINGGKFRFFATPSWDATQYNWLTFEGGTVDVNLQNGNDGDGNFLFGGTTGWYKITADTKDKTITLEATDKPELYMIGDALQGWDLGKAVALTRLDDGVYQVKATFTSGNIFRFFTAPDWSKGTINYPYFNGGDVDPLFENANDGDKNFKFVGATGDYTITVDLNNLTVTMDTGAPDPIYMIGDATGGWDLAKAVEVSDLGSSKYEAIADFTNGGKFRFFETAAWDAKQYNWSTFEGGTIPAELQDGLDGDGNFSFVGTTGSYKITVDLQNKTIVMVLQ